MSTTYKLYYKGDDQLSQRVVHTLRQYPEIMARFTLYDFDDISRNRDLLRRVWMSSVTQLPAIVVIRNDQATIYAQTRAMEWLTVQIDGYRRRMAEAAAATAATASPAGPPGSNGFVMHPPTSTPGQPLQPPMITRTPGGSASSAAALAAAQMQQQQQQSQQPQQSMPAPPGPGAATGSGGATQLPPQLTSMSPTATISADAMRARGPIADYDPAAMSSFSDSFSLLTDGDGYAGVSQSLASIDSLGNGWSGAPLPVGAGAGPGAASMQHPQQRGMPVGQGGMPAGMERPGSSREDESKSAFDAQLAAFRASRDIGIPQARQTVSGVPPNWATIGGAAAGAGTGSGGPAPMPSR